MNEIESELEQMGAEFLQAQEEDVRSQIKQKIEQLKNNPAFCLGLCNLISNPQTPTNLAIFYINIAKDESKYLFSSIKKSVFGKELFTLVL